MSLIRKSASHTYKNAMLNIKLINKIPEKYIDVNMM